MPFADPLADGPVIREAAEVAREANEGGFGLAETIDLAAEFVGTWRDGGQAAQDAPPVALMTYLNPLMRAGLPAAAARLREAGVGGVIIPDLPVEMARPWLAAAGDLDTVFLAAPTSTPERLARIDELSGGFVYCVSTTGVTGERAELPAELADLVARVKARDGAAGGGGVRDLDAGSRPRRWRASPTVSWWARRSSSARRTRRRSRSTARPSPRRSTRATPRVALGGRARAASRARYALGT